MKLISLNAYGGYVFEQLIAFIASHAATTDIFCFQEMLNTTTNRTSSNGMRVNLMQEINRVLTDFQHRFATTHADFDFFASAPGTDVGMALWVKNDYKITADGEQIIHYPLAEFDHNIHAHLPHKMIYTSLEVNNTQLLICNIHGSAMPSNKLDSPERILQSKRILAFASQQECPTIITGDFNLLPHTRSVEVFEGHGYQNLIKDYMITTTRGSLHKELHPEYGKSKEGWQEFADYIFVSPEIKPLQLDVPDLPVSDHLPMILEFEIL